MKKKFVNNIVKVDTDNTILRHYQVSKQIKQAIRRGHHQKGDCLPSERKLSEYFGVSRITIRRALDDLVRENILEKVIGKGTYVKDPFAPTMKGTRKLGITFWQENYEADHPATLEVLKGIAGVLAPLKHYTLEMIFVSPNVIRRFGYIEELRMNEFDGIILAGQEIPSDHVEKLNGLLNNLICTNRYNKNVLSVSIDFYSASLRMTEYLIRLGHEKIALVNGPEYSPIAGEVLRGYREAMYSCSLETCPEMLQYGNYDYEDGFALTERILADGAPTALIVGDDFMALGAMGALKKAGLRCPSDVSIVSFNDFFFSRHASPALSTVRIPFRELGEEAARIITSLVEGKSVAGTLLRGEFMIRESVAPLRTRMVGNRKSAQ
ncbi:MAG: GntR family transcriptional regulator [Candidatus Ratteibacteria bacterium]